MSDTISPILQWLNAHPNLAGLATFIISAAESVAIIGTIVPGSVMMAAIGTLAGAGVIPLYSTVISAILGAIVGDGISYWAGYHYKDHLRVIWPFKNNPQLLDNGERFFHKFGGASVLIGRFIGPVRALVPLIAGMLGMQPLRFYLANIVSAIFWAPAYMLPGILLGAASLELPSDIAIHVILMFLLIVFTISLSVWLIYKIFVLIHYQINQLLDWIWEKLDGSRHFHILTTVLKHHNPKKMHGQLTLAFYLIITSAAFLYLCFYIKSHQSSSIAINNAFYYLFRSLRTDTSDLIALLITQLGEKAVLVPAVFITTSWLLWKRSWHTAAHVFGLLILTSGSIHYFKHIVESARPWGINGVSGFSFPSGHTALATSFYLGLALLFIQVKKIKPRGPILLASLLIIAVGISRIYLGAHWFTDVLGGLLLGSATLMLIILSYNRSAEKSTRLSNVTLVSILAIILMASAHYFLYFTQLKYTYHRMEWPSQSTTVHSWWDRKGTNLPIYRIGRIGLETEVLNVQWVGKLDQIKTLLLQQGWEIPMERGWLDVLHRITDVSSAEYLPIVSPLYLDKKPALVLIKSINSNKNLVVLRLWPSNLQLADSKQPLWVGSVGIVPRTYSWLFKYRNTKVLIINSNLLFTPKPASYQMKEVSIRSHLKHKPHLQKIILIKPKTQE